MMISALVLKIIGAGLGIWALKYLLIINQLEILSKDESNQQEYEEERNKN